MNTVLSGLRQLLQTRRHRALVILSGSQKWQQACLNNLWSNEEQILWSGNPFADLSGQITPIDESKYQHWLGQEVDSVVLDVHAGLSANGLGILSGLIRTSGLMILLTPSRNEWSQLPNPANRRFLNTPYQIEDALPHYQTHLVRHFEQHAVWLEEEKNAPTIELETSKPSSLTLPTKEQQQAIDAIHRVAFGHRKRPLVLSADRGRGKTSALGLGAVECLLQGKQSVVFTASRYDQVAQAFAIALTQLNTTQIRLTTHKSGLIEFEFQSEKKQIEFIAPDELILNPVACDVLLVDEAAHLPAPMLTKLLSRYHRLVFATTLHGYEGSGRGFELRFKQQLDKQTPDWKALHLNTPIRWAEHDPLEQLINQTLLLSSDASGTRNIAEVAPQQVVIKELCAKDLINTPQSLDALFQLLVLAHYQTTPNDLQQLLSAPNLTLLVAQQNEQIIGTVLCVAEGKLNSQQKRVHGHLTPQLLQRHYAQPSFGLLSSWRIMRIAVHPSAQRLGVGQQLLSELKNIAKQQQIDYLSSSFGASEDLLPFWFNQHYLPLHVGTKRDKASGSYNVVVALPLSSMAQQAIAQIHRQFQAQFPHTLMEALEFLPTSMALDLLKTFRFKQRDRSLQNALLDYSSGNRPYEAVSQILWSWSLENGHTLMQISGLQQSIWCDKVLKKHSWQVVAHRYHLTGRKGAEKHLKEAIAKMLGDRSASANVSTKSHQYAHIPFAG